MAGFALISNAAGGTADASCKYFSRVRNERVDLLRQLKQLAFADADGCKTPSAPKQPFVLPLAHHLSYSADAKPTRTAHRKIQQLFTHDLAAENDFLRVENKILRELISGKRPHLTERHRRLLVKYGIRIEDRLSDIAILTNSRKTDEFSVSNGRLAQLTQCFYTNKLLHPTGCHRQNGMVALWLLLKRANGGY